MKVLVIINDPPYGTDRCETGLHLTETLVERDDVDLRVFLTGDAVWCAVNDPNGFYSPRMTLQRVLEGGGRVACRGSSLESRAVPTDHVLERVELSSTNELADWTLWADETVSF